MDTYGNRVRRVVVCGGGTDGWMTAAFLGKALQGTVRITVLESERDRRADAGEATAPDLHHAFFGCLGINEDEWMRACGATFKMAVRFVNWRTGGPPEARPRLLPGGRPDHAYHSYGLLPDYDRTPLSHYWFKRKYEGSTTEPFDYACYREPPLMDAGKAPRWLDGRPATRYAWHVAPDRLTGFLRSFATGRLGVRRVTGEPVRADQDSRGFVTALRTGDDRVLEGDLFIDCSGFRARLLHETLGEPFLPMNDRLPCDAAVVTTVPHDDAAFGIEPYTSAVAMPSGWAWRIPMFGGFSTGYVHTGGSAEEEAAGDLCALWGLDRARTPVERVAFRVGRARRAWVKNVVGIGRSAGFLEPLQPTGLHFVTTALHQLVRHFPDRTFNEALTDSFNQETETVFEESRDFLQAHYAGAPRDDTPFWKTVRRTPVPPSVRQKIAAYRAGLPINPAVTDEGAYYGSAGPERRTLWTNGSYYSVLSGLGLDPDAPLPALALRPESVAGAEPLFEAIRRQQHSLLETLPSAYDCLRRLHDN